MLNWRARVVVVSYVGLLTQEAGQWTITTPVVPELVVVVNAYVASSVEHATGGWDSLKMTP